MLIKLICGGPIKSHSVDKILSLLVPEYKSFATTLVIEMCPRVKTSIHVPRPEPIVTESEKKYSASIRVGICVRQKIQEILKLL